MNWPNLEDPVVLVIGALILLVAYSALPYEKVLEFLNFKVQAKTAKLQLKTVERDIGLLEMSTDTITDKEVSKTRRLADIAVDAATRQVREHSKVHVDEEREVQIHVDELQAEDDAALRAAKLRDDYDRAREKKNSRRSRGGAEASRAERPVSQPDGQASERGEQPPGPGGRNSQAADRFGKPNPPDPDPGLRKEG